MLFVLRKIRKKLMDKNRLTTYLFYAIGEIILVVLGILIALQINGWNEGRLVRKTELHYIQRLIAENRQDIQKFDLLVAELNKGIESVVSFSVALNDPNSTDENVFSAAQDYNRYGAIAPVFSTSRSTFDDLSNTGNLQVIRNVKLRDRVVKHYAKIDLIKERLQVNNDWVLAMDGPHQFKHSIMQLEGSTSHLFPNITDQEKAELLRRNRTEFINNAAVHHWVNEDAINELRNIQMQSKELIAALEKYIGATGEEITLPDPLAAGWKGESVCEVVKETDDVRILKCVFPPGVGHEKHYHAPHTGYTLSGGKFRMTDSSGTRTVDVPSGTSFGNDQVSIHEVLNVGETTGQFLIIETKE